MFEIFWDLAGRPRALRRGNETPRSDILAQPQIERMDEREIADLPLTPRWPGVAANDCGETCTA